MINIKQTTSKTQTKFYQYFYKYKEYLQLPEYKFILDVASGMLKSKHIHLAKIARTLFEKITPKKTEERLSYHLGKEGLYKKLQEMHLQTTKHRINHCQYLVFDGSDIIKEEAEKMEGLSLVRDGSKSVNKNTAVLNNGYHWDNIIGVSSDGSEMLPLYSEIYGTKQDPDYKVSENRKIINIVRQLNKFTNPDQILVIDRGGDRRTLINPFLKMKQSFIIRQMGTRDLFYNDQRMPLKKIYRKAKLDGEFIVKRNHHNRKVKHTYKVGAIRVQFPTSCLNYPIETPLWLVVTKEDGRGYSWFLCNLPTENKFEAIKLAMKGYQYRWKVEEFHRQIKQDYKLEDIRFQRYEAIKNIGSIILIVMGFLSSLQDAFVYLLLFNTRLLETNKFNDLPNYTFYRLTEGIKIALASTRKHYKQKLKIPLQPTLNLFP